MILDQCLALSHAVNGSSTRCNRAYTRLQRTMVSWWHQSLVSGSLLMAGDDDVVYDKKPVNVMPKTAEQHLIVRSDKSEASVTDCAWCIRLLKLTADGHRASCGLSATAELLVVRRLSENGCGCCHKTIRIGRHLSGIMLLLNLGRNKPNSTSLGKKCNKVGHWCVILGWWLSKLYWDGLDPCDVRLIMTGLSVV